MKPMNSVRQFSRSVIVLLVLLLVLTGCKKTDPEKPEEPNHDNDLVQVEDNVLVVYFSATGTTEKIAETIAEITGGDLVRIIPKEPYSSEDLKYTDSNSRSTREQNDKSVRPEIANDISLEGVKTLYLGYPIWWGQAPRIMDTFAESHDFSGITVIPFCTSGSSDIGTSDDYLAGLAKTGNWLQGRRFSGSTTKETLESWIKEHNNTNMEKTLKLYINSTEVKVSWEDNESVKALKELVKDKDLTINMSMYGGFEQVGPLGTSLVRNDKQITTQAGDIVLYSGNQIVVFYGSNSWAYTRLGKITDKNVQQLKELLGNGDVTITITAE